MIFLWFLMPTVSSLIVVSACYAARIESPAPGPLEQRGNKKKRREPLELKREKAKAEWVGDCLVGMEDA